MFKEKRDVGGVQGLVAAYQQGMRDFSRADLSNQDLSGLDLEMVDLQNADLSGTNLSKANLTAAKLDAANLKAAVLIGTVLSEAYMACIDLVGADLREADLQRADLTGANLEQCVLDRANLKFARLRKANLKQASLRQAYLRYSQLQAANLTEACLQKADLTHAKLGGANLTQTDLRGADLSRAEYANIEFAILGEAEQSVTQHLHLEVNGSNFAFSPNSERLAYVDWDKKIIQMDLSTGEQIARNLKIALEPVVSVVFSANGGILYSSYYVNQLKMWNPSTGELIRELKNHSANITSMVLNSNLEYVGTIGTGEPFCLFDVGHETRTFKGYSSGIQTQAHSPDGRLTARSGPDLDCKIELLDRQTNRRIRFLTGHKAAVQSLAFSPDNKLLVSSCAEYRKIWQLETGKEIYSDYENTSRYDYHPTVFYTQTDFLEEPVLVSNDFHSALKQRKAKPSREDWMELEWNGGGAKGSYSAGEIALSADRKVLARHYRNQPVQLWNLQTGEELGAIDLQSGYGYPLALNPTGNILAVGESREFYLWNVQTQTEIRRFRSHSYSIRAIVFSPDGQMLASGSYDARIKLWDLQTGCEIQTLQAYSTIYALAFHPLKPILASGNDDGIIKLWDLKTLEEIHSFRGHQNHVTDLAFSLDGKWLASSDRGITRLWDLKLC